MVSDGPLTSLGKLNLFVIGSVDCYDMAPGPMSALIEDVS